MQNNSNYKSSNPFKFWFIIFFALGLGLGLGLLFGQLPQIKNIIQPSNSFGAKQDQSIYLKNTTHSQSYAHAIKRARSAVVNVFSEKNIRRSSFWDLLLGEEEFSIGPENRQEKSLGSGVIISADGYIVTNSHVIKGADKIYISFEDEDGKENKNKQAEAKLIGADSKTDLALLKIERKDLPYLPFSESDNLQVGDIVLAVGNPFGIGQTVTMGIVSAIKRNNLGILDQEDFIQTDAAINLGNSGGALIDASGNLIGINTAIFSRSGGYQGICFAVPSKLALKIITELQQKGRIERMQLGVSLIDLNEVANPLTAYLIDKGYKEGALIAKLSVDGAASRAGMVAGSLITEINGQKISSAKQVLKIISETQTGQELKIKAILIDLETGEISNKVYTVKPQKK